MTNTIRTYSITLPDGTVASRKSPRPYQAAVVVCFTEAYRAHQIAVWEAEVTRVQAKESALAALVTDADRAALPALEARYDATKTATGASWDEFRAASDAFWGNAERKRQSAAELVAREERALERARAIDTNTVQCYGWSMSDANAEKMANKARKVYPGARVYVETMVAVREHGTRAKKSAR